MRRVHDPDARGFTLVEMLVAIAIFGIMSAIGYRALDGALTARDRVSEEYRVWRDVARAVSTMERDLEAIQPRPVRDASGAPVAAVVGTDRPARAELPTIAFTRRGETGGDAASALPRRTGYRVRDGALERLTWPVLDQGPRTVPGETVVLTGVRRLAVRYRDVGGRWWPAWPAVGAATADPSSRSGAVADPQSALPVALEVTLDLEAGGRIQRLIPLLPGVRG